MADTIYHYTGVEAFEKIIDSGRIRATHYSAFEDKNELRLGIELLRDAVKQHPVAPQDQEYRDFLIEGIDGFAEGQLQVYVLSLTEMRNSTHHWQRYADGGVAIGFCRERVQKGFPIDISRRLSGGKVENPVRPDPANRFMQCRYLSTFDLPALVATRFFTPTSYPEAFRSEYARANPVLNASLSISIYRTICAIKGPDYFDDAEWRCVHINPSVEDYPVKTGNGRSFIEMQFNPAEFVTEVWIGPLDERQQCEDSIERLRRRGSICCSTTLSSRT